MNYRFETGSKGQIMTRHPLRLLLPVWVAILPSCVRLQVTKVPPDDKSERVVGIRYSLPAPFIKSSLQPDGAPHDDVIYLPDPDCTYAIDASSFAGAYTAKIEVADGLLTKIQWAPDATA